MIKQAEINIGTVGHVDHGKTTVVRAITGEWTDKHSEEIKRGITIRLGYADAEFYFCEKCNAYLTNKKCAAGHVCRLQRKVSFVDCPGHENLMAVTISGASLMDGAMFVIAANEPCPMAQTREHLGVLDIVGIKNIVIIQSKIDLVSKEEAKKHRDSILEFVRGTIAENAPVIPVAATYNLNTSEIIQALQEHISTPERDLKKDLRMYVARSFDVNKPSTSIKKIVGGVIGGSIVQGTLKKGDEIEIAPGILKKDRYEPIITKAVSLSIKEGELEKAVPGGLIGVGTLLDPRLTKGDELVGNVVGMAGKLPAVHDELSLDVHGIKRMTEIKDFKSGESVVINSGTATTLGVVSNYKNERMEIKLKKPICAELGSRVALSKKVQTRWCLAAFGVIK